MTRADLHTTQWKKTRLAVLNRDDWVCAYCNRDLLLLPAMQRTADHVIPTSAGGTSEMHNLVACCKECNSRKQDRVLVRQNWYNEHWLPKMTGSRRVEEDEDENAI